MNGKMLFQLGTLRTEIAGGPYKAKPAGYLGVKMAEEIDLPCEIDIPTRDFQVPSEALFKRGLVQGIMAIAAGNKLYAGCWGGIGRTGLYLAGMAKVMAEYKKKMHRPSFDPVLYVRGQFLSHAVETKQQEQYIADLDVSAIVEWWHFTQRVMQFDPSYEEMEREHLGHPVLKTGVYADSTRDAVAERFDANIENDPLFNDDLQTLANTGPVTFVGDPHEVTPDLADLPNLTNDMTEFNQEMRIERLEGCVVELSSQLNKLEVARLTDLRACHQKHLNQRKWWQIWK